MHRHLAMRSAYLRHPMMSLAMNDRHRGFAILCIRWCAGRAPIVEVIADPAASEYLSCDQLRMHVSLPITQEKLVRAAGLRPKLGIRNSDGRARSAGRTAENERINAFSSDHARVWARPRRFFDNGAFEGTTEGMTGQQHGHKARNEKKFGTHRQRGF